MANGNRHQATNVLIEPIDASAAHVTQNMIVLKVADEPRVIATGRCNNTVVVRSTKGWPFKSRYLHVDPGFFKLTGHEPGVQGLSSR
jgi:hypothetical protein